MLRCDLSSNRPSTLIASRGACRPCSGSAFLHTKSPSHRLRDPRRSLRTIKSLTTRRLSRCSQTTCASSLLDQAWGTHINAQASAHTPCTVCSEQHIRSKILLQELATNIFSTSIIPYSAFLYWLTKSRKTPPLALFGFYFLLVFVFATIPAGVIGTCLALRNELKVSLADT